MIHRRFLLAAAFIILIHAHLSAMAQLISCGNTGNYTTNSPYFDNLNYVLSSLSKNIGDDGFYSAFTGVGIDRANAIALCAGDLQLNACRTCVQTAAVDLVTTCPNQKQAIRWAPDSSCMLRYSNATIYGAPAAVPGWYMLNLLSNVTSPEEFEADLRALLEDLRRRAAAGDSVRMVAAGNVTEPGFETIFAMVQCSPDLSSQDCTSCLVSVISEIPICCDKKRGGRVLRPSCNLRFETYPFFNETRLRELEFVSPPQPQPPPPPPPSFPVVEPPTQSDTH